MLATHRSTFRRVLTFKFVWGIEMITTPAEELRTGFWFARKIADVAMRGEEPWAICLIFGQFPFLRTRIVAYADDLDETVLMSSLFHRKYEIEDPRHWEFGPRIEFPSE